MTDRDAGDRGSPRGIAASWWSGLSSLVLPVACAGCGRPDDALCGVCRDHLVRPAAREIRPAAAHTRVPVFAAAPYEGVVRELLVAWKDGGRLDLTGPLAQVLARVVDACLLAGDPGPVDVPGLVDGRGLVDGPGLVGNPERRPRSTGRRLLLVPVPSSRAAVRRRGEDVLFELARWAAGSPGPAGGVDARAGGPPGTEPGRVAEPGSAGMRAPVEVRAARLLAQRRGVRDQAGLGTEERLANTAGRVRMRRSWEDWRFGGWTGSVAPAARGVPVVLVDDIVTTGASLAAAAAALTGAGVPVLGAATVAWTPRRRVGTSVPDSPALRTVGYRPAGLAWMTRPDERGEAPRA